MIDYFALALGHGLIAIALLRLVLRDDCDVDPLLERLKADTEENRRAASPAGRNAARRAQAGGHGEAGAGEADSGEQAAQRERAKPGAQAAQR